MLKVLERMCARVGPQRTLVVSQRRVNFSDSVKQGGFKPRKNAGALEEALKAVQNAQDLDDISTIRTLKALAAEIALIRFRDSSKREQNQILAGLTNWVS